MTAHTGWKDTKNAQTKKRQKSIIKALTILQYQKGIDNQLETGEKL